MLLPRSSSVCLLLRLSALDIQQREAFRRHSADPVALDCASRDSCVCMCVLLPAPPWWGKGQRTSSSETHKFCLPGQIACRCWGQTVRRCNWNRPPAPRPQAVYMRDRRTAFAHPTEMAPLCRPVHNAVAKLVGGDYEPSHALAIPTVGSRRSLVHGRDNCKSVSGISQKQMPDGHDGGTSYISRGSDCKVRDLQRPVAAWRPTPLTGLRAPGRDKRPQRATRPRWPGRPPKHHGCPAAAKTDGYSSLSATSRWRFEISRRFPWMISSKF